jgi:hypothetical protein
VLTWRCLSEFSALGPGFLGRKDPIVLAAVLAAVKGRAVTSCSPSTGGAAAVLYCPDVDAGTSAVRTCRCSKCPCRWVPREVVARAVEASANGDHIVNYQGKGFTRLLHQLLSILAPCLPLLHHIR